MGSAFFEGPREATTCPSEVLRAAARCGRWCSRLGLAAYQRIVHGATAAQFAAFAAVDGDEQSEHDGLLPPPGRCAVRTSACQADEGKGVTAPHGASCSPGSCSGPGVGSGVPLSNDDGGDVRQPKRALWEKLKRRTAATTVVQSPLAAREITPPEVDILLGPPPPPLQVGQGARGHSVYGSACWPTQPNSKRVLHLGPLPHHCRLTHTSPRPSLPRRRASWAWSSRPRGWSAPRSTSRSHWPAAGNAPKPGQVRPHAGAPPTAPLCRGQLTQH